MLDPPDEHDDRGTCEHEDDVPHPPPAKRNEARLDKLLGRRRVFHAKQGCGGRLGIAGSRSGGDSIHQISSGATKSSKVSRRRIILYESPSTSTSAARGRLL